MFIAEFGYYYGWEGMVALMNNEVTFEDASVLLAGARKVWSRQMLDMAAIVYTSNAAVQSGKKAKTTMTKGLKEFMRQAKADI